MSKCVLIKIVLLLSFFIANLLPKFGYAETANATPSGLAYCCDCVCKAKNGDDTTLHLCTVNEQGSCKWRVGKFCEWGLLLLHREGTIKSCGSEYEVVLSEPAPIPAPSSADDPKVEKSPPDGF